MVSKAAAELVVLVGLQGSGKSSFTRERFGDGYVVVSKDQWPHARNRDERQRRVIADALAAGRSVVVDNTNVRRADRAPLVALGHGHGARVVCFAFATPIEECLRRNAGRSGRARVPDKVLYITRARLEWPTAAEGFAALHRVVLTTDGLFEVEPMSG